MTKDEMQRFVDEEVEEGKDEITIMRKLFRILGLHLDQATRRKGEQK